MTRRPIAAAMALALTLPAAAAARPAVPPLSDALRRVLRPQAEPGTWSLAALPPGPDGRVYPVTAGSPDGLFVLFGGSTEHGIDNDAFWFDSKSPNAGWRTVPPGGVEPPPRAAGSAAWDSERHRMLLFGGVGTLRLVDDNALLFGKDFLNDVWALQFDPAGVNPPAWQQLHAGSDNPLEAPSRRAAAAAVYDSVGRRLIVHGGNDTARGHLGVVGEVGEQFVGIPTFQQGLEDIWAFDLATSAWTKLAGGLPGEEPNLFGHQAVYDPASRQVVVTGGSKGNDPNDFDLRYNERTWSFDLATSAWTEWSPLGESPAMYGGAFGYSAERGALVVSHGWTHYNHGVDRKRVYALRLGPAGAGSGWEALPANGAPHPDMVGTAGALAGETLFMLGGNHQWSSNEGYDNDARLSGFDLTGKRWHLFVPDSAAMSPTAEATAVYDSTRRHMLVVGGRGRPRTVWDLDLAAGSWRRMVAAGSVPEGDKRFLAAFDSARGRLLVMSGRSVHALTLGAEPRWSVLPAVGDAPELEGAHAIYDPVRDRLLLVGGQFRDPEYSYYFGGFQKRDGNDRVFALHLSGTPAWRELTPGGSAPERIGASAAYDATRDRVLLFGGSDQETFNPRNDVVELTLAGQGAWRPLEATGTPPTARDGAVVAFDAGNDRLLVYGGEKSDPATYALGFGGGGATWSKVATTGDPAGRDDAGGIYDDAAARLVVFGGYADGDNIDLAGTLDTFALALGGSAPPPPAPSPLAYVPPGRNPVRGGTWSSLGPTGSRTIPVALSPAFAADRTIYAGTIGRPKVENQGAGIYVSRDAGATWQLAGGDAQGAAITRIVPAPSDPARVYAAARGAESGVPVYVSRDRGATWQAASEGLTGGAYFALAVSPADPDVIFAGGDIGGLYRSLNAGASWDPLGFEGQWVYGLQALPIPGGVRILAATRSPSSGVHGAGSVYLSDDLGQSWDLVFNDDDYVTYGFAVDPSAPSRVLLSAGNGIWRSEDSGRTYEWLADRAIQAAWLAFDPTSDGDVVYGAGVRYGINFNGVAGGPVSPAQTPGFWRSTDGGTSWEMVESLNEEDFGGVAVSPDGAFVIASALDTGPYVSQDRGATFQSRASGFNQGASASISADATLPNRLVAAAYYDGALVSDDGGQSWFRVGLEDQQPLWYVAASPVKSKRLLGGNYSNLYKSENGGLTWIRVAMSSYPGTYYKQPGGIAFHPTDANTWYVTTNSGEVAVTHDNGGSFTYGPVGSFAACLIPLAASPAPGTLLVGDTCGAGVLRSDDGGSTWTPSSSGISDGNITGLAFHPTNPDLVWAGTLHRGVYRSTDGGRTWEGARVGLGYRYVRSLAVDAAGRLYAAVRGGGVYESDDGATSWTPVSEGLASRDPLHVLADAHGRVLVATNGGGVAKLLPGP